MLQNGGSLPIQKVNEELHRSNTGQNIVLGGNQDMTVEQLLDQLAKKGKKVKLVDGEEVVDHEAGEQEIEEDINNQAE